MTAFEPVPSKLTFGDDDEGTVVEPAMSISGGPGGFFHAPIHESLTLSALINVPSSGVAPNTSLSSANNADWEFIRGVIWNDDPAGLLFDDEADVNHTYAKGFLWWTKFTSGEKEWNPAQLDGDRFVNVIGRGHFGDMQFLHCMAAAVGEQPGETKRRVMIWMEVMYKLSNGEDGITPDNLLKDTKLGDLLAKPISVPGSSVPPMFQPLSYMLAPKTPFKALDIRRRALGSMFHVIQDSYAIGHTQRVPLNKEDQTSVDPLTYKPGTTDRWGAILNFHTYFGQNSDKHAHYDHPSDAIPEPENLGNLDQWNSLIGCRDAADKCVALARMRFEGKKWDDGVARFLDEDVFGVDEHATPANDHVL
ncbi:hypothetical protein F5X68DRAFT_193152 [Plectosphaerella plurivora]|uniref:Uncharacterized protein n=1 Tax=Plectosphaerella plurivora TaxID=936078 RepID=A0A9P8V7J6_9PEZI|nr:hypothetical protein F5X68DRAFT_193152 [Plectosphaerella plurivora]